MKLTRIDYVQYHWNGGQNLIARSCFVDACQMLNINIRKNKIYQTFYCAKISVVCIEKPTEPFLGEKYAYTIQHDVTSDLAGDKLTKFFYDSVINILLNDVSFEPSKDEIMKLYDMPHRFNELIGLIKLKSTEATATCHYSNQEFICNISFKSNHCVLRISDSGCSVYKRRKEISIKMDGDQLYLIYKKQSNEHDYLMSLPQNDHLFNRRPRSKLKELLIEVNLIIDFSSKSAAWSKGGTVCQFSDLDSTPSKSFPDFTITFGESLDVLSLPCDQVKRVKYSTKNNAYTKAFWQTISRVKDIYSEEAIRSELVQLTPQKLADFHLLVSFYMGLLDNDDFSQHLKFYGDSDDLFSYVRGTVIMSGEKNFKAILAQPELISEFDREDTPFIESLEFIAEKVAFDDLGLSEDQWERYLEKSKVDVYKL